VFDPDRRHLIAYLAAATVLVVIGARLLGGGSGSQPVPSISMAAPSPQRAAGARPRANTQGKPLIWVDVAGSVRRPGLYSLPDGARVAAALERAGGVRAKADRAAVNLAAKLTDGQQVFVPSRAAGAAAGAAASAGSASAPSGSAGGASAPSGSAAGGSAAGASGAAASGGAAGAAGSARISLSNASQAQLEELDGIGPALAQRIIEYRQQHGGFRSIDELQEVSGIGEKRFEALKASIAP
jgi:competence protein ComEA